MGLKGAKMSILKTEVRDSYKETRIGMIPAEWDVVKVKDVITSHKQGFYTNKNYSENGGIKLVRITDLLNPKLNYESMPSLDVDNKTFEQFKVDLGDFLVARSGAIGRYGIALNKSPCIFGSYIIRFRLDQCKIDNYFFGLLYESSYILGQLARITQGSSNININAENIKSMWIPRPPLYEQQKIVVMLSSVDATIEKTDAIIAQMEWMKEALMQELFTKGIGHAEFKETKVGKIPKEWDLKKLSDLAEIIMGQSPSGATYNALQCGKPLINGPVEFGIKYPTPIQWTSEPIKLCKPGDILFCVRGSTTGRMNLADQEYCIGRGIAAIRGRSNLACTSFILYLLKYKNHNIYKTALGGGSTFPNITSAQLQKYLCVFPNFAEQCRIGSTLSFIDEKIEHERIYSKQLASLRKGLMQDLLTGKVRVTEDAHA